MDAPRPARRLRWFALGLAGGIVFLAVTGVIAPRIGVAQGLILYPLLGVLLLAGLIDLLWHGAGSRLAWLAMGAVMPTLLLVAAILLGPAIADRVHRRSFDSAIWKSAPPHIDPDRHWPVRLRMVDDLLTRHTLIGMRRDELEALLGPSDMSATRYPDYCHYYLGPERGLFRIDGEHLRISLKDGVVVDVVHNTD